MDNKVAIVYGGSYGIGKGISCAFSDAGATVVIVSRDKEKGIIFFGDVWTRCRSVGVVYS